MNGGVNEDVVSRDREQASGGRRLAALDAHRGLIMVLMAIDHASYFVARVHSREMWGAALPVYPDAFWFFEKERKRPYN